MRRPFCLSAGASALFALAVLFASHDAATAQPAAVSLDICPDNFGGFPEDGPGLTCGCSAEATRRGLLVGANPYDSVSGICQAALHAGAIGSRGGQVSLSPAQAPFFPAVTRNGVSSQSGSAGKGFQIAVPNASPPAATLAGGAASLSLDICPDNFGGFPEDGPGLTCGCSAEATRRGLLVGANPYDSVSGICQAALHAGAIGSRGGQVSLSPAQAPFFPAVTRNGVSSQSGSAGKGFQIAVPNASPPAATLAGGAASLSLDICPDNFGGFPEDGPGLTCGCSAEATRRGLLVGANPYDSVSGICQAALHAGAIGPRGGQVSLSPAQAPFFPAVTRNGVSSQSGSAGKGFQILVMKAAAAPASDASGRPVQAPIAATLRAAGKVQVYINFATASDRIEGSSGPVLEELLATLHGDPSMRIELVGHTDTQGSAPYNLDLSQRRAASVYGWLSQHGVARERLRSSGRGFLEPLADNDTERGRALNRRVEVKLAP